MLNHLSLGVRDIRRSMAFYDAVLAPLGYRRVWTLEGAAGYGPSGHEEPFAIKQEEVPGSLGSSPRSHVALTAPSRDTVDSFHEAALRNGGEDLGGPGLRIHYGENYYAAFIRDPDGYRIEAVCLRKD